jgi:phosphoglycolate phosphatase-like HAD superfamily hydrolase
MYVISGTPDAEIKSIVARKGLDHFFLEVHGSPVKKTIHVADILSRKAYSRGKCLFIGDALSDFEAAKFNRTHFKGVVPLGTPSIFPNDVSVCDAVHVG